MLIQAETEKQEELHVAASAKAALTEKVNRLTDLVAATKAELDKLKWDSNAKAAQDRVSVLLRND